MMRRLPRRAPARAAAAAAFVVVAVGCASADNAPPRAALASGAPLPVQCVARAVADADTAAFVAAGRAWAIDPRTGELRCLFAVERAGPFAWGPRGDRALLARLEVKGLRGAPTRPPAPVDPQASAWGRPIGKSIVFVGRGGHTLLKAHPAGGPFEDITPVAGGVFKRVVYHPSGLALAFILRRRGRESVWISSNTGTKARQIVHGRLHTGFDAIAFGQGGTALYFGAQHPDRSVDLHVLALVGATAADTVWRGGPDEHITDLFPGRVTGVAFTVGRSCRAARAMLITDRRREGVELLPDADRSRALGWLDDRHVLAASGGCGG